MKNFLALVDNKNVSYMLLHQQCYSSTWPCTFLHIHIPKCTVCCTVGFIWSIGNWHIMLQLLLRLLMPTFDPVDTL